MGTTLQAQSLRHGQRLRHQDLAFLAFEASKLHKVVVPAAFDQFINELEHIEILTEEPAHPTLAAPSDDL